MRTKPRELKSVSVGVKSRVQPSIGIEADHAHLKCLREIQIVISGSDHDDFSVGLKGGVISPTPARKSLCGRFPIAAEGRIKKGLAGRESGERERCQEQPELKEISCKCFRREVRLL
jgi:hypothetical protein